MKDLKLDFTGDKPVISFEVIEDSKQVAQKAIVNLCTMVGSDKIYEDRGTRLFYDAVTGNMFSRAAILRSALISASDTKYFVNRYTNSFHRIKTLKVELDENKSKERQSVAFKVQAVTKLNNVFETTIAA